MREQEGMTEIEERNKENREKLAKFGKAKEKEKGERRRA